MTREARRRTLFTLFFASGFCGLLYQVVWLRLAFAAFGITTPVLSIVVSVFMLGLGLGAWIAGPAAEAWRLRTGRSPLVLYALVEIGIGTGSVAVPALFRLAANTLLPVGSLDSAGYHLLSGLLLASTMLPWCTLMGATFPLVMAFVREAEPEATPSSFSFLYLANVLGAAAGTIGTALVLVELLGFSRTLLIAGAINVGIAMLAFRTAAAHRGAALPSEHPRQTGHDTGHDTGRAAPPLEPAQRRLAYWTLFTTGACSMASEVVWTRSYTPVLQTYVYSFASLLTVYLLATFAGSWLYRRHLARSCAADLTTLLGLIVAASLLPLFTGDPRVVGLGANVLHPRAIVLLGIVPFCMLLGYVTPQLVDRSSGGSPAAAGRAYAINVAGCIVGPLVVSYVLLPQFGARWSLLLLAAPLALLHAAAMLRSSAARSRQWTLAGGGVALGVCAAFLARSFEDGGNLKTAFVVRRDSTATVISHGTGLGKKLLVNGIGITAMDRCTKFMAHLPMSVHGHAESALVICFGMGTTFRSLRSWDADVTAVELVPSVRDAFPYYFDDAAQILSSPKAHIVVDDGRRFLQRTSQTFDVVTLDPPPPVEAAGSSLLYTQEFYRLVKARLRPGGVLQAWFPGMSVDDGTYGAVLRSLTAEFPHVRAFRSTKPYSFHYLASMEPIVVPDADAFVARMPAAAQRDLVEWNGDDEANAVAYVRTLLAMEVPIDDLLAGAGNARISDDRPYNEYYALRRTLGPK